ncbi:nuclear transport factor 2 family protein [Pseudochelatococcus sp. B33]
MMTSASLETIEKVRAQNVVATAIIARDTGLWSDLAECYHPDAVLTMSWFSGSPAEFVKASQEMKISRSDAESQKHMTSNLMVRLNGRRAVSECDLILYQRRLVSGVLLDFTTWSRRIDLLENRDGEWRISHLTMIYEKDRMDAVDPKGFPAAFLSSMELSQYPQQIRFHCWRNDMVGFPPARNICIKGSDRELQVREEARRWLA